jgi:hypothetical protein
MEPPKLEFAFELRVKVLPPQDMGVTAKGVRKIVSITGGSFEGPEIRGTIVPGGYDWQLIRGDGVAEIEARYVLKTDDGALITIVNTGLRHGPAEIMQKLAKGEAVDPSLYYFRLVPFFETSEKKYDWLTKNMFLATGIRQPDFVVVQVWKIM